MLVTGSNSEGDAAELSGVHFEHGAALEEGVGDGIEDALAPLHALAVVALDILHAGVFAEVEGVHAVVFRLAFAGVVDAAARDYDDIRVLADEEIVVSGVLKIAHGQDDGDVDAPVFDSGCDDDVDAGLVRLLDYADLLRGVAVQPFAVLSDVEAAFGDGVQLGYFFEKFEVEFFHISSLFRIRVPAAAVGSGGVRETGQDVVACADHGLCRRIEHYDPVRGL